MKRTVAFFPLFLLIMTSGCSDTGKPETEPATPPSLSLARQFTLTSDAEGGSARPEIAATNDRIFVAYLAHINGSNAEKTFDVKIFDKNLSTQLSLTTIVPPSADYGNATDIRIAKDDQVVYAFYETSTETATYLHGAKFALTDTFDLLASPRAPIATAKPVFQTNEGDEILNDPAPLVGPNSVFVATRIFSSITTTGHTRYRIREFDKTNFSNLSAFDLDLSGIADGRARVASLLYWNNNIYMALATTVSDQGANDQNHMSDDGAMCDILLVKMAPDWTFDPQTGVRTISAEPDDHENYITGLRTDGVYFYLTYKQAIGSPPTGDQIAVIKVYDADFNQVYKKNVTSASWGSTDAGEIRPSLEVFGDRIYSGQSSSLSSQAGNGKIYVYEMP